jgi:hypothetical protein
MDVDEQCELEIKLDKRLNNLLGYNYCVDTEICDDSLHVLIYEGPWEFGGRFIRRLDYDLTILESGVEEAAKLIHLDWLFS